jgi:CheY-like chemotaxis protein
MNYILLVEDDPLNRAVIEDIVEFDQIAAELTCVETGEESLECARELRPALILMDVGLPGINGLETTRRLKQIPELNDTPVWAISAHAMKGDAEQALSAGCSAICNPGITVFNRSLIAGYLSTNSSRCGCSPRFKRWK